MSDYRRLISYIYAYEGGVKGKNIGYAKVEIRGGQCRIQVNVKRVFVGSNETGVYLLAPEAEILLGRIFIRGGAGEFRTQINAENVEGSGIAAEQFYGLTIHDVTSTWRSYTTVWEDAVAQTAEVQLADITSENMRKRDSSADAIGRALTMTALKRKAETGRSGFRAAEVLETEQKQEAAHLEILEERGIEEQEGENGEFLEIQSEGMPEDEKQEGGERFQPQSEEASQEEMGEESEAQSGKELEWEASEEEKLEKHLPVSAEIERDLKREEELLETIAPWEDDKENSKNQEETAESSDTFSREEVQLISGLSEERETQSVPVLFREPGTQSEPVLSREAEVQPWTVLSRDPVAQPEPVLSRKPEMQPDPVLSREPEVQPEQGLSREPEAQPVPASADTLADRSSHKSFGKTRNSTAARLSRLKNILQPGVLQSLLLQPEASQTAPPASIKPEADEQETQSQTSGLEKEQKTPYPELENPEILRELERQEAEENNRSTLWERLQRKYTRVLAFECDRGCEILSIKPQDIGLLPREIWVYGNNSFLLHGYYNYRHLILARLSDSGGRNRYLLGVPGHYFSNEKYMASMFGFPHFVLAKKQPDEDGRFGYWYTDIRL